MNTSHFLAGLVVATGILATPAIASDEFLRFDGAIGVITVGGIANGAPVLNTVRGIPPGGRPWVLREFKAKVKADASISARGEGLLLGGSDNIGLIGGVRQVALTLTCQGPNGTFTSFNSDPADLDANGNFEIKGMLSAAPSNPCTAPVLLVRNATGGTLGSWFAAGILRDQKDD